MALNLKDDDGERVWQFEVGEEVVVSGNDRNIPADRRGKIFAVNSSCYYVNWGPLNGRDLETIENGYSIKPAPVRVRPPWHGSW